MSTYESFPQTITLDVQRLALSRFPEERHHHRLPTMPHVSRGVLTMIEPAEGEARLHLAEGSVRNHSDIYAAVDAASSMVPISESKKNFLAPYTWNGREAHIGIEYSFGDMTVPIIAVYVRRATPSLSLERFVNRMMGHVGQYVIEREVELSERKRPHFYGLVSIGSEDTVHATYDLSDAKRLQRKRQES